MKLTREFYTRTDVVQIARDLLGKELCTHFNGVLTSGIITETEAYAGVNDKASHAYGGRRTARTEIMFAKGGTAYVYLCYGMHSLFNVVTNKADIPHAVLVRAIRPVRGIEVMIERRGMKKLAADFTTGPGKVAKALGIHYSHSGMDLLGHEIWVEDNAFMVDFETIEATPRIGIDYAGNDAALLYRFLISPKINF